MREFEEISAPQVKRRAVLIELQHVVLRHQGGRFIPGHEEVCWFCNRAHADVAETIHDSLLKQYVIGGH